jgi:hypothetical protein
MTPTSNPADGGTRFPEPARLLLLDAGLAVDWCVETAVSSDLALFRQGRDCRKRGQSSNKEGGPLVFPAAIIL